MYYNKEKEQMSVEIPLFFYFFFSYISESWKSQQYEIDNFDFENKKITFKKSRINKVKMEAPEWFNSRKLTQQDKMELILYLDEFKRKKGL